jgi:hypothetical protein
MVTTHRLDAEQFRFLLRDHTQILEPGEALVVMVPPEWGPAACRDIYDALNAILYEHGITAVVTPALPSRSARPSRQPGTSSPRANDSPGRCLLWRAGRQHPRLRDAAAFRVTGYAQIAF